VAKLGDDQFDKKYEALYSTAKQNLIMAFRCPSMLVGVADANNGFNSIEYESAFKLYNKTMIGPLQKTLIQAYDEILGPGVLQIVPYTIKFDNE